MCKRQLLQIGDISYHRRFLEFCLAKLLFVGFNVQSPTFYNTLFAGVAELADARDLKSRG